MPSLRHFVSNSDYHGARHVFDQQLPIPRRLLWTVMFLAAFGALVYFAYSRTRYFYTYPTSMQYSVMKNKVPLPGIVACVGIGLILPQINVQDMSDADIIFLLATHDIPILTEDDVEAGSSKGQVRYQVNRSVMDSARKYATIPDSQHSYQLRFNYDEAEVINRTANIHDSVTTVDINQYYSFLKRYGLTRDHIEGCMFLSGSEVYDCLPYMRQVLTSAGACMVLDNINGSQLHFTKYRSSITDFHGNMLSIRYKHIAGNPNAIIFHMYDPYETLEPSVTPSFNGLSVTITKVVTYNLLDVPYGDTPCVSTPRTDCIKACVADAVNASCLQFHEVNDTWQSNKPPCKPSSRSLFPHGIWANCSDNICPEACHSTDYQYSTATGTTEHANIYIDKRAKYDTFTQVKLFEFDALLADLGSNIGLFIGASVLTLYHTVEYLLVSIYGRIKKCGIAC